MSASNGRQSADNSLVPLATVKVINICRVSAQVEEFRVKTTDISPQKRLVTVFTATRLPTAFCVQNVKSKLKPWNNFSLTTAKNPYLHFCTLTCASYAKQIRARNQTGFASKTRQKKKRRNQQRLCLAPTPLVLPLNQFFSQVTRSTTMRKLFTGNDLSLISFDTPKRAERAKTSVPPDPNNPPSTFHS
jgi:hypothetical protein